MSNKNSVLFCIGWGWGGGGGGGRDFKFMYCIYMGESFQDYS